MELGFERHDDWNVDEETLKTVVDMAKLQEEYVYIGDKNKITTMNNDIKIVVKYGKRIKLL